MQAPARAGDADAGAARAHLVDRLRSLQEHRGALCFGRIDHPSEGIFYIGRRHVEDASANPVVVDWRAPIAAPFYRATAANPLDLHARRRFVHEGPELVAVFEEIFDDPDHPELATGGGVPDPLLAELERARAGELRDIVATIQAEQDEIIRAPLDRTVIVQLRMLGRRAPNGSLTVLGDFAQATAPAATSGWPEVARHLGVETSAKRCDLVVGYRLPASILDWANRLLAEAAPGLSPARSVRLGGRAPIVEAVESADLAQSAVRTA